MKRFTIKLFWLMPVILFVVGLNWLVDPVHLRDPDEYERGIARLILQGKPVTNILNPNEAAFITEYVRGLQMHKDVLVFGSSRSKLIRADVSPGRSFFNNSISGAGLADYRAIYRMYHDKGFKPALAVIELSPWILTRGYASVWKAFNAGDAGHRVLRADVLEFLSPGYFQTSLFTWLGGLAHPVKQKRGYLVLADGAFPMGETLLADGSAIYPERVQHPPDRERVTALAVEYAGKPAGVPGAIDPDCERALGTFLDELTRDGVRVVLYLPPYHPKTFALMSDSSQNKIIVEEQRRFEALARRKELKLIGSYNPADVGLDEVAFFDGSHATEEAVRSMFAAALPGEAVNHAPPARVELTGVTNPNGLEVVDGKPFLWIGAGDTCLNIRSPRAGTALITFHGLPGPSIPETATRNINVKITAGFSKTIALTNYPAVEIAVVVAQGANEICLTPLDKPTVLQQPNGDRRPLILTVTELQVTLLPTD